MKKTFSFTNLFFYGIFFLNIFLIFSEESTNYITGNLGSQLGNQLFVISTTLVTAWEYGITPVFPDLEKTTYNIPLNREKIFFRLSTFDPPDVVWNYFPIKNFSAEGKLSYVRIPNEPNLFLIGYNWNVPSLDPYKERLIELFSPSDKEEEIIQELYGNWLKKKNVVAVHVRAYANNWFLGEDYFKSAMNLFPDDYLFVVFSCRIDFAKHFLSGHKPNMIFIKTDDHVRDFFLMNKCTHHIISNSSFAGGLLI